MREFNLSYQWLSWRPSKAAPPLLPRGIERRFISTPSGDLEVLRAGPAQKDAAEGKRKPALFFIHGGMGGAWVWLEYMQYFAAQAIPCYALSLRGHGQSWQPSYLRMVYGTGRQAMVDDLVAGIEYAEAQEGGREVVLVGHSTGGALAQYVLSKRLVRVRALALLGAVPGTGSLEVYLSWWWLDPWFLLRMIFHGGHPNSPLSHPALTKAVFFSPDVSDDYLTNFQQRMCPYESYGWATAFMRPSSNLEFVLSQISGWGQAGQQQRLLVMTGGGDRITTVPIERKLAGRYRDAFAALVQAKKIDAKQSPLAKLEGRLRLDEAGNGVRFNCVPIAGHHLQNDAQWEVGAAKLLAFYEQL